MDPSTHQSNHPPTHQESKSILHIEVSQASLSSAVTFLLHLEMERKEQKPKRSDINYVLTNVFLKHKA